MKFVLSFILTFCLLSHAAAYSYTELANEAYQAAIAADGGVEVANADNKKLEADEETMFALKGPILAWLSALGMVGSHTGEYFYRSSADYARIFQQMDPYFNPPGKVLRATRTAKFFRGGALAFSFTAGFGVGTMIVEFDKKNYDGKIVETISRIIFYPVERKKLEELEQIYGWQEVPIKKQKSDIDNARAN